ncbi:MAG: hypothetical protein B6I31_00945 [Desulfobacteraceae bacterium 4572_19]|nr:MAG: hypothetical protein B6I31_00945 [Desulfobacteraceae bacterium 4572_19]
MKIRTRTKIGNLNFSKYNCIVNYTKKSVKHYMAKPSVFNYSGQIVMVFFTVFFMLSITSVGAQEDIVIVNDSGFTTHARPSVAFLHDQHNEDAQIEDCNRCHHVYKDGKFVEDESSEDMECSECHNKGGNDQLARIYHINCKGCHTEEKAGPVMCVECHVDK